MVKQTTVRSVAMEKPIAALLFSLLSVGCAFAPRLYGLQTRSRNHNLPLGIERTSTTLCASGKGFGKSSSEQAAKLKKTYQKREEIQVRVETSEEIGEAMEAFFTSNKEWHPLFLSLVNDREVTAMSHFGEDEAIGSEANAEYSDSSPWKSLDGTPTNKDSLAVVASWLDSVHQSLIEIPIDEANQEMDDLDRHFIEEGKRMLAISRFHVLSAASSSKREETDDAISLSSETHEDLFMTCWSEVAELRRADAEDTGSVILLPGYNMADIDRFTEANLNRPLDWLGIGSMFEVSSFQKGVPAIRLLHKLSAVPTDEEIKRRQMSE